jgi:nitroimidazol reductase NimA-like FMN-containing flavoprotein (pyridoxamine 5'-phosphate oxidase superfamily)
MGTDLAGRILSFLDANHVISLATTGPDRPHATNLFYARDGYTLLWLSNSRSHHSVHIDTHPQVSATIAPDL